MELRAVLSVYYRSRARLLCRSSFLFDTSICALCMQTSSAMAFGTSAALQELLEFILVVFVGIDPAKWKDYRARYVETMMMYPLLKLLDHSPIQCYVEYYLLINILTMLHRDVQDGSGE